MARHRIAAPDCVIASIGLNGWFDNSLLPPAPCERLLALPRDDRDQRDRSESERHKKPGDVIHRPEIWNTEEDEREIREQDRPSLPCDWKSPTPSVSFCRKSVLRSVLVHLGLLLRSNVFANALVTDNRAAAR